MKKILFYILVSCLFFCSCASNSSDIGTTEEINETPTFVIPEASNEDGNLYFTCQNWNSDIYINDSMIRDQEFYIISLEPLDMKEIKIIVPIQNDYIVKLTNVELEEMKMTDYTVTEEYIGSEHTFKYYLYQTYRGIDWKKMRELYDAAEEAKKLYKEKSITYEEKKKIENEYKDYQNLYVEDYEALTAEDLPTFYLYAGKIFLGATTKTYDENGFTKEYELSPMEERVSESFQTIDIQIGDKTYTQNIGEVRIHTEFYPEHLKTGSRGEYIEVKEWPIGISSIPFGDGIMRMAPIKFTAEEDLILTNLYMYEGSATALSASVIVSDTRGNIVVDMQWDLKSPISIEKGQEVSVRPIIQDMNAIQLEYGARCCPVLEYTVGEETYYYMEEQRMDSLPDENNGLWIRYAAVFDGLAESLKDYFTYYYPIYEDWREGLN